MSIHTTAPLANRVQLLPRRRAPREHRARQLALAIWAVLSDREAWTPPVDRVVAGHAHASFRML